MFTSGRGLQWNSSPEVMWKARSSRPGADQFTWGRKIQSPWSRHRSATHVVTLVDVGKEEAGGVPVESVRISAGRLAHFYWQADTNDTSVWDRHATVPNIGFGTYFLITFTIFRSKLYWHWRFHYFCVPIFVKCFELDDNNNKIKINIIIIIIMLSGQTRFRMACKVLLVFF